jgi:hypothetical protein
VTIPQAVFDELAAAESPAAVQNWIRQPSEWLEIQTVGVSSDAGLEQLDAGEREAILLASHGAWGMGPTILSPDCATPPPQRMRFYNIDAHGYDIAARA